MLPLAALWHTYIQIFIIIILWSLLVKIPCLSIKNKHLLLQCLYHLGTPEIHFFLSCAAMLCLTIYLTLLVERQPGPLSKRSTFSIPMYNCSGLGHPKKLKRFLLKLNVLVNKGCVVLLQLTHIVNTKYLEMIWKHVFFVKLCKSQLGWSYYHLQKAVWSCTSCHKYADHEGRQLIAVIRNDERKFIVVNAYFTNDHKQSLAFASLCTPW
jgi:hypothetical protein